MDYIKMTPNDQAGVCSGVSSVASFESGCNSGAAGNEAKTRKAVVAQLREAKPDVVNCGNNTGPSELFPTPTKQASNQPTGYAGYWLVCELKGCTGLASLPVNVMSTPPIAKQRANAHCNINRN